MGTAGPSRLPGRTEKDEAQTCAGDGGERITVPVRGPTYVSVPSSVPARKRRHVPRRRGTAPAGRAHANERQALPTAGRQGPAEYGGEAGASPRPPSSNARPSRHTHRRAVQPGPASERQQRHHRKGTLRKTAKRAATKKGQLIDNACPPTANDTPPEPDQGGAAATGWTGAAAGAAQTMQRKFGGMKRYMWDDE